MCRIQHGFVRETQESDAKTVRLRSQINGNLHFTSRILCFHMKTWLEASNMKAPVSTCLRLLGVCRASSVQLSAALSKPWGELLLPKAQPSCQAVWRPYFPLGGLALHPDSKPSGATTFSFSSLSKSYSLHLQEGFLAGGLF